MIGVYLYGKLRALAPDSAMDEDVFFPYDAVDIAILPPIAGG